MRIGIDARFLTHPQPGGFKTYTVNLIASLAKVDTDNEYILYTDRPPAPDVGLPNGPNFRVCMVPGSFPTIGMLWREQIGLARQAARDRLDLLHAPSLTAPLRLACPTVVTIHDMIWYFPNSISKRQRASGKRKLMEWYYQWVSQRAARNASAILTVSQHSKQAVVECLGLSPDRIFVTYPAASPIFRRLEDRSDVEIVQRKFGLSSSYMLAIGSADPRKNITTLVRAYAALPDELQRKYRLALVWTHHFLAQSLAEQIEELGLKDKVQFLEHVSNQELVALYNAASLFVFPSRSEGFGLPVVEAMVCGTPVVAARNSSIPEVVGDAALLVNAEDARAISGEMVRLLTDEALRLELIHRGINRAKNFSWEKCACQTLEVYRRVLSH